MEAIILRQLNSLRHKLNNLTYNTFDENNNKQRQELTEMIQTLDDLIKHLDTF